MGFLSKKELIDRAKRSPKARERLVESNLDKGIAYQIRATRNKRQMSQGELASKIGMSQNNVSRLESPEYGKQTLTSLKKLASALDVALIVRFIPFSQYIDWLSGTPHMDEGIRPESLAVPSFEDEEKDSVFEKKSRFFRVDVTTPEIPVPKPGTQIVFSGNFHNRPITPEVAVPDSEREMANAS